MFTVDSMIFGNESDKMNVEMNFETYWEALDEMQRRIQILNSYGYTSLDNGIKIHHNEHLKLSIWGLDLYKYVSEEGWNVQGRYPSEVSIAWKWEE